MAFIDGGNNPGHRASVNAAGQLETTATQISAQTDAGTAGDAYNVNSAALTLTSDVETPIVYFKNDTEDRDIIVDSMVISCAASTGGSGPSVARIVGGITGGTLITGGVARNVANLNLASRKTLGATALDGATGLTVEGGDDIFNCLLPTASTVYDLVLRSLVLPRGASFAILLTPPAGNTSLVMQTGISSYLRKET